MPYKDEFAKINVINDLLKGGSLKRFINTVKPNKNIKVKRKINFQDIKNISEKFKYATVIDGSKINVILNNKNSCEEKSIISIINVAQTTFNLENFQQYTKKSFPDPLDFYKAYAVKSEKIILPVNNIIDETTTNCSDFFRKSIYDFFSNNTNPSFIQYQSVKFTPCSLLDTFKHLLLSNDDEVIAESKDQKRGKLKLKDFISNGLCDDTINKIEQDISKIYFITDLLGFHRYLNGSDLNTEITIQSMLIIEKIMLLNYIENIIKLSTDVWHISPQDFFDLNLLIIDGPLSNFGDINWLGNKISSFINSFKYNITIVGVEKTGSVVNLLDEVLDTDDDNNRTRALVKIDDDFYEQYLNTSKDSDRVCYFGDRYIYINKNNSKFVFNHMNINSNNNPTSFQKKPNEYCLAKIVSIFDEFGSTKYRNGLSLISIANENASISNSNLANRVVNDYIQKELEL